MDTNATRRNLQALHLPIEQGSFLRALMRELAGTLARVVGPREASGFLGVVGQRVAHQVDRVYRSALDVPQLTREQLTEVLLDLERRVGGDFFVVEEGPERLVLGNRRCPYDSDRVAGEPAVCTLTATMLGSIVAENLGWAKVELQQTIAGGAPACRVVLHLRPSAASERAEGREYLRG